MNSRRWLAVLPAFIGLCGCGGQATQSSANPSLPPSPKSILLKVEKSSLKDVHFALTEQLSDGSGSTVQASGDGVLVLKPSPAMSDTVNIPVGGTSITVQNIEMGDTIYHKKTTDTTWTASRGRSGLTNLDRAYDLLLKGEEMTPQGKAWHLSGTDITVSPFDIWIREKDGYLLKYSSQNANDGTAETYVFDRYNTGQSIVQPPASQVVQG